jgi:hypothetical protein
VHCTDAGRKGTRAPARGCPYYTPKEPGKHSIIELEGLGKEIWNGVDVEKYIDEERNSWDG